MVQEQFGFGVNTVSAEGAGKVYEVLAQNSAREAATAKADAGTAMNEYTRSISTFSRYFQESQNTNAAAAQTASRANEAENAGREGMNRSGKMALAYNAQQAKDVVTAVNTLNSAGATFAATVEQSKLQEGIVEGMKRAAAIDLIADPTAKLKEVEAFLTEYQADPQSAYNQGVARSVFPLYSKAVEEQDIQRRETVLRSAVVLADNSFVQSGDEFLINMDAMRTFAKDNNVPMGEVRDVTYSYFGRKAAESIRKAETPQELMEAKAEWEQTLTNNFDNEFFIKSKNEKTQHLIGMTDREINASLTFVQQKFKVQGEEEWNDIKANPNLYTTEEVQSALDLQQLNPLERQNKLNNYSKLYADQEKDEYFRSSFTDTTVPMGEMWKHAPETTVRAAELRIGDSGFKAFVTGNSSRLQEILEANPGHTKEIGLTISKAFTLGTAEEKAAVYGQLIKTREVSTASQALSQVLEDGELGKILTIGALANTMPAEKQEQVADNWTKATQMVSNQKGSTPIKLTPNTDSKLYDEMVEDATKLGNNAGRFMNTVQMMYGMNPDMANEQYDTVVKHFENLTSTFDTTIGEEDRTLTEDKSHAPDPFTNSKTGVLEKHVDEAKQALLEDVTISFNNKYGYKPNIMSMTYLPNGVISLEDEFGNSITHVSAQGYINNFREAKNLEETLKVEATKAMVKEGRGGVFTEEDIFNMDEHFTGFLNSLMNSSITINGD